MSQKSIRGAILVLMLLAATRALADEKQIVGVALVIDGDTVEIHGQRIRLFGIDAPESSQLCVLPTGERWRCGQQGSFALADRIGRATVACQPRDIVAVCFKGNEDLNRWMVITGWAVAFRRYSVDYVADEDAARQSRINISLGDFDMPWVWRAQRRHR